MNEDIIDVFEVNTDAIATNRGFYYQYLILLKRWITNYISGVNDTLFSEVDDDIKQVGEKLTFTQVKCYSKNFSFQSEEIQKTIFNYFILFLKDEHKIPITFCFSTNTGIAKSEKLLKQWSDNITLQDETLRKNVILKIQSILNTELKKRKRKKLEIKGISDERRNKIKDTSSQLSGQLNHSIIDSFVKCIKWEFLSENPVTAITNLSNEINILLSHDKFNNKPISTIKSVLLSEIYKCSQLDTAKDRILTIDKIDEILTKTIEELRSYENSEFLRLVDFKFEEIGEKFYNQLKKQQRNFSNDLEDLTQRVTKVENLSFSNNPLKELSLIPTDFGENYFGRETTLLELSKNVTIHNIISITGNGGEGKTLLVQKYLNENKNDFDHVIWINSSPSLQKAIIFDQVLLRNLNLKFDTDTNDIDKTRIVCNELNKIRGRNLLIIDSYENGLATLNLLKSLNNWKILITTQEIIDGAFEFKLPKLDYTSLKSIYEENFDSTEDKEDLTALFNIVEHNPLVIKLCAKTIANSVDLNLKSLLHYFNSQNLDDISLEIEVNLLNENYPIKLFTYLKEKFEFTNLTEKEKRFTYFLALLPSENVSIEDITHIAGTEHYKSNLVEYTNLANSLHRKGWVERKGNTLKMHRLIQELIIYSIRSENGFITCIFQIIWLTTRIDETAQNDPSLSFKYLRYAESILKKIKEPYRDSIYQPLLILENALLNAYNWIENSTELHLKWIDLAKRAQNSLPVHDVNLTIINNNLGYSYARQSDFENAIKYFKISIDSFSKTNSFGQQINSMNNLIQTYLSIEDIENARKTIENAFLICKKRSFYKSQFTAALYYLSGSCFLLEQDFKRAADAFKKAIETHISLDEEFRNKFYLFIFYIELIFSLFIQRKDEEVLYYLEEASKLNRDLTIVDENMLKESNELINTIKNYYNI